MMGAAGVFMVVDMGDKAMNYVEVNARVSEVVDEDCWLELGDETWKPRERVDVTCAEVVDGGVVMIPRQYGRRRQGPPALKLNRRAT